MCRILSGNDSGSGIQFCPLKKTDNLPAFPGVDDYLYHSDRCNSAVRTDIRWVLTVAARSGVSMGDRYFGSTGM
jgi:hypothetical protein